MKGKKSFLGFGRNRGAAEAAFHEATAAAGWSPRVETARLKKLLDSAPPVGLFVHDSLHTYENERAELELGAAHLAPDGVLLSDNAHATRALADVCASSGLRYFEFRERPAGHFYPGGATGAGRR